MSDPLSIAASVAGLVSISAVILCTLKGLSDSYRDAPASIQRVVVEVQDMCLIFEQVQMFIDGTGHGVQPSHQRLSMIPIQNLVTTLTGCVLVYSRLDEYVCKLVGKKRPNSPGNPQSNIIEYRMKKVKWVLWREAEVKVVLEDLQRHKMSLSLMLSIIHW
ncbi:hypothetical protein DFH27DRAFT_51868 [Peziza echinospora]|nr:hypothetical protein DFH27DRAFT_51868 [Peziza echinospora]